MYYEEKIINDVLCTRGTPDGEWIPLSPVALTTRLVELKNAISHIRKVVSPYLVGQDECEKLDKYLVKWQE